MAMCTAKVDLSATAVMSYVYSVFLTKRRLFLYNIGVSHWLADHALVNDVLLQYTYPPTIGPTLGATFSLSQVLLPLAETVACALGLMASR